MDTSLWAERVLEGTWFDHFSLARGRKEIKWVFKWKNIDNDEEQTLV